MNWRVLLRVGVVALAGWLGLTEAFADPPGKVWVVDVLVVYTPAARTGAGGSDAIRSQIQAAFLEANLVLQNSRVNARLQLVRTAEVNYVESGSVSNDLARLRNPKDGFIDDVPALRDQSAADLVCLVTETGSDSRFYGLQGPSAANAFSIIRRSFLTGNYYFPVALSFNFGCQLERNYADSLGAFPYAYGYSFAGDWGATYSTVEAFSGQRLPFFSNPEILWQNTPAGVLAGQPNPADNARALNQTAPIVAAFRGQAPHTMPPTIALIAPTNGASSPLGQPLLFQADATDVDGQVSHVDFFVDGKQLGSISNSPFQLVSSTLLLGPHVVAAVAADDQGAQTVSESSSFVVRPANDDFARRQPLQGERVVLTNSNEFASTQPDEPPRASASGYASVWWSWAAPASGQVTISLQAAEVPGQCNGRVVEVYLGDSLTNLASLASAYDDYGSPELSFPAVAGMAYAIVADSAGGPGWWNCATGPFEFRLRLSTVGISAPFDGSEFTSPNDIAIDLASSASDGPLSQAEFFSDDISLGIVTNAPFSLLWRSPPLGSHILRVVVGNADGEIFNTAPVTVNVRSPNDDFANSTPVFGSNFVLSGSTVGASSEPGEPCHAGICGQRSIWWSWTAPLSGYVTIQAAADSTVTHIAIYTGDIVSNLTVVAQQTDGEVNFEAQAGIHYYIVAADLDGGQCDFGLTVSTVRIESPADGSRFLNGSDIPMTASVAPNDGQVVRVDFFSNQSIVGSVTNSPFSLLLTNVPGGAYILQAAAVADSGLAHRSAPVSIGVRPANDDFADAQTITANGPAVTGSNRGATSELGEHGADNSIWWSWTAPTAGRVRIEASGRGLNPVIRAYTGNVVSNLSLLTLFSPPYYVPATTVEFNAEPGVIYHISVSGDRSGEGEVSLSLLLRPRPANDDFADRTIISVPSITFTDNIGTASPEVDESEFDVGGRSLWWTWRATNSGQVTLVESGDCGSSAVGVYTGDSLSNLTEIVSDSGMVRFMAQSGTTYQIAEWTGDCANFAGTASLRFESIVPVNDQFTNRVLVSGVPLTVSNNNVNASTEPREPSWDNPGRTLWWAWTAPATGLLHISTAGSSAIPMLAVFSGTNLTNLVYLGGNLDEWGWGFVDSMQIKVRAGQTYCISADEEDSLGVVVLNFVGISPTPSNDDFADRGGVYLGMYAYLDNATVEPGEPSTGSSAYEHSVWWTWTAPYAALGSVWTLDQDLVMFVYTGTSVSNLTLLAEGEWAANFYAVPGSNYIIRVIGMGGNHRVYLDTSRAPTNDSFANRMTLMGSNITVAGVSVGSSHEPGEPIHAGVNGAGSDWWSWSAPATGCLYLSVNTGFSPIWAVYQGLSITNLKPVGAAASSSIKLRVVGGNTYDIAVDSQGWPSFGSTWTLAFASGPPNDDFNNAAVLDPTSPIASNVMANATIEPGEPCLNSNPLLGSAWYSWTAPASGIVTLTTSGSNSGSGVGVFTGDNLTNLTPVVPLTTQTAQFRAADGITYKIVLQTADLSSNAITLSVDFAPNPPNDDFAHRALLGGIPTAVTGTIFSATHEQGEPMYGIHSVWYSATIATDGWLSVTTASSGWTPTVAAYQGTSITNLGLAQVGSGGMRFVVQAGNIYALAVSTDDDLADAFTLTLSTDPFPGNDAFANGTPINGVSAALQGSNFGATRQTGEPDLGGSGATVWWSWTAPTDGSVTITNTGSNFSPGSNPLIAVFMGDQLTNLILVASNSFLMTNTHSHGTPLRLHTSAALAFQARAGTNYHIAVDGVQHAQGSIQLTLEMAKAWLREPAEGSLFVAPTNIWLRASPIDFEGVVEQVDFFAGTNWLGMSTNRPFDFLWENIPVGDYALSVQGLDEFGAQTMSPPVNIHVRWANDNFANRFVLDGTNLTVHGNNAEATSEPGEDKLGTGKTLWWTWIAPADGMLTLDVSQDENRPVVSVLTGEAVTNLLRVAHNTYSQCDWCSCATGTRPSASTLVTNGQVCLISMDVLDPATAGQYDFQLRFRPPPSNDAFEDRQSLSGSAFAIPVSNWAATGQVGEPNPTGNTIVRSVWYSWTAPQSGRVTLASAAAPPVPETVSTKDIIIIVQGGCGSIWETPPLPPPLTPVFSVYLGSIVSNLSLLAGDTTVTFEAVAGVTYAFAVDGSGGTMGEALMQLRLVPNPANDDFARRIVLQGVTPLLSGNNIGASLEPGEPGLDPSSQGSSVWWTWTAPANGTVRIGEDWNFNIGVFVGSSVSALLPVALGYGAAEFYACAGTTYQIAVADAFGSQGTFDLQFVGLSLPIIGSGTSLRLADGRFQMQVNGRIGQSFLVQASTNLVDWATVTVDTVLDHNANFIDDEAPQFPQRFYRLLPLDSDFSPSALDLAVAPGTPGSGFTVRISGPPGQPFSLRASSDLVVWTEINRGWIIGDFIDFMDGDAASLPARFYQLVPFP